MVSIVAPTYPVAPTITPRIAGLLSVATVTDNFTWLDGNDLYDSYNCMQFGAEPVFCNTNDKTFDQTAGWTDGALFGAYGGVICKAIGLDQPRMLSESERVFGAGESTAVERGLMKYRFAESEDHWDAATSINGGTSVCPAAGLAMLEAYAASIYVGVPTLHLPLAIASLLLVNNAVVRADGGLRTQLGSKVVAGAGYDFPNLSPTGTAASAGEKWIYATGEVSVIRGPLTSRQEMNYSTNEVLVLEERPYIVAVDCFSAGIEVTVTC